ncbi:MAG: flagellar type III secretion system protein FliR [Syntrophomonadaceae bacterium]|jgi:flagellar biosynthetic protein FliR|nr:flagellar type III secretion system protein FliR [Syntrophomonadaceae bacterium]
MALGWEGFLLVIGRISGLFISSPVLSARQIPIQVKVLLIVMLSGMVAVVTPLTSAVPITHSAMFITALAVEIFIGYTLGFVAYVLFAGIQLAGQLMDMQMGFGLVNVIDPQSGTQVPLIGNFNYLVAIIIFLSINGHHYLLQALSNSYQMIPVLGASFNGQILEYLMQLGAHMFVIGLKLAVPVVAALFMADLALGFIARTVPQMNVFVVGLPFKIGAGLVMVLLTLPIFIWFTQILMDRFFGYLDGLIILLGK